MDIEALALVNIASTVNRHVNQSFLFDLPDSPGALIAYELLETQTVKENDGIEVEIHTCRLL